MSIEDRVRLAEILADAENIAQMLALGLVPLDDHDLRILAVGADEDATAEKLHLAWIRHEMERSGRERMLA